MGLVRIDLATLSIVNVDFLVASLAFILFHSVRCHVARQCSLITCVGLATKDQK